MKKFYTFTLFFLLFISRVSTAGASESCVPWKRTLDSLARLYEQTPDDSLRINILHEMAQTKPDSLLSQALEFYQQALRLGQKNNKPSWRGRTYSLIGITYLGRSEYPQAIQQFSHSITQYGQANDELGLAKAYNNLGLALRRSGRYQEAILAFAESLKKYRVCDNPEGQATVYNNLAQIHLIYGDYTKAISYFSEYVEYNRAQKNGIATANGENNLGATYFEMNDLSQALAHYYAALRLYDSLDTQQGKAIVHDNIGLILRQLGQIHDAIAHHLHALAIYDAHNDHYRKSIVLGNLSGAYRSQGEFARSLTVAKRGLEIADSLSNPELQALLQEEVAKSLTDNVQYKEAVYYYQLALENVKAREAELGKEQMIAITPEHNDIDQLVLSQTQIPSKTSRYMLLTYSFATIIVALGVLLIICCRSRKK